MPRYSNAQLEQGLREAHGMLYVAAQRLGCSPTTIKARLAQSAALRDAIATARGLTGDTAELKLFQAIQNGEPWAIQFYLRMQARDRGYVEHQEVQQSGGVTIRVQYEDVDPAAAPQGAADADL